MQDNEPLISVAMCTFNGARFLELQLQSIVEQSYPNLEIVIADDGSTDETVAIVRRFQQRDARIRLLEGAVNLGFIRNFERALAACKGDVIALADQDDVWFPDKIATLWKQMDESLLIYSRVQMMDEAGCLLNERFPGVNRLDGACALALVVENCVTGHACLIRRELLKTALPFPAGIKAHDQWLALIAAASGRMKASDSVLSYYRRHSTNALLGKKKRKVTRAEKNRVRDECLLRVMDALTAAHVLTGTDQQLMEQFGRLLARNRHLLFNWRLSAYLKKHQQQFLALYFDPDKARKKLCRGDWYFRLLPFA